MMPSFTFSLPGQALVHLGGQVAQRGRRPDAGDRTHAMRASKTEFDLSTAGVIKLSKSDVPAAVIEAMRNPAGKAAAGAGAPAATRAVVLMDGVPFEITLMEDVPNDPAPGLALHFQAAKDHEVNGAVTIAKGAAVTGEVLALGKKNILRRGGKPMFRLIAADAVDGTKLKVKEIG